MGGGGGFFFNFLRARMHIYSVHRRTLHCQVNYFLGSLLRSGQLHSCTLVTMPVYFNMSKRMKIVYIFCSQRHQNRSSVVSVSRKNSLSAVSMLLRRQTSWSSNGCWFGFSTFTVRRCMAEINLGHCFFISAKARVSQTSERKLHTDNSMAYRAHWPLAWPMSWLRICKTQFNYIHSQSDERETMICS